MLFRGVLVLSSFTLSLIMSPGVTHAFDHELQLGGTLFYAQQFIDEETRPPGGGLALRARYGLNDWIALAAETAWAGHSVTLAPEEEDRFLRHIVTGAVGVHYAVDVFRYLPYLSVLVGVATTIEGDGAAVAFLLDAGGGMDWMVTDSFSIGVSATYQLIVGETISPARLCVGLRLSWHRRFERAPPGER